MGDKGKTDIIIGLKSRNKQKQRKAFDELYAEHAERLLNYSYRFIKDKQAAEDILQDCFLNFFNHIQKKKEITNVKALLFTITRNLCLTYIQRLGKAPCVLPIEEERLITEEDETIKKTINDEVINIALADLSTDQRNVVILKYFCGYNNHEIADLLGIKSTNVNILVYRAKKKLAESITPFVNVDIDNIANS